MKYTLLYFSLVFICFVFTHAEPPAQERYLQANALYEKGEYAKAYDIYKGISYKSPEMRINMGNAASAMGNINQALVLWRQAQQHVKPFVYWMLEERTSDVHQEHGGSYHASLFERVCTVLELYMRYVPQKMWELLFLLVIALGFFVLRWIEHRKWVYIIAWSMALLVISSLLMVRYTVHNRQMGMVMRDSNAYVTKDAHARIRAAYPRGQEVNIRAMHDGWYLVTDGTTSGWMMQNDLQLV